MRGNDDDAADSNGKHPDDDQSANDRPMTHEQFYEFCLANHDLRIERTASGEVVIMPPAFSDTGNRNFNIAVQLGSWANQDGTGLGSIPVQALPYRTARLALPMLRGSGWSAGMR